MPPPTDGWWGDGPSPLERWPGVTLSIPATWHPDRCRWESHDGRYYYDVAEAEKAHDFFPEFLEHHKGEFAGEPFVPMDYQRLLILYPLFGWKRASDDLRRFRKVFLAVPKGNGKTPLGAGIGLYLTECDNEPGAEVYAAAADRDQAAILFDTARYMVEHNDDLDERSEVLRRAITVPSTHSYFRVLSSEAKTKHGPNIHGLLFDEFHAQTSRDLYETLYRGTVKRRQPVVFLVTTAGDDDESICAEEWEYARRVIDDPSLDETYLPVVFEASREDDWTSPELWRRVNPGLGITVKTDALKSECTAATLEPRKLNDFLRYHLNIWTNQATSWLPIEWWDKCEPRLSDTELAELPVFGGIDMAQKYDLAAFVLAFPSPLDEEIEAEVVATNEDDEPEQRAVTLNFQLDLVPFFWIPENTMKEHAKTDRVPYPLWVEQGLVTATEGDVIDYNRIVSDIDGPIAERFPRLRGSELAYDPAFATDVALRLQDKGYRMVEVLQNYRYLSEPCHIFEALLKAGRIRHDGQKVLRWNISNVEIKQDDAMRIRPVKPKRRTKRIDGVVSAVMALSRAMLEPYDTDDLGIAFG